MRRGLQMGSRIYTAGKILRIVGALLVLITPSASAHSAAGSPSSNYRTTITSITPRPTSFTVRSIEQGSRLEVSWLSGEPLIVTGYEGEPYLELGASGVRENQLSAATFINRDRNGTTGPPNSVNPDAAPQWKSVSTSHTARFHDHRAHYMGSVPPEKVTANPDKLQLVQEPFEILIRQGRSEYVVAGVVEWVPGPSPTTFIGAAFAVALSLAALAWWAGVTTSRRLKVRPLIVSAIIGLVAVDVLHLVGIAGGVSGGNLFGRLLTIGYASIVAWILALVSALLWVRNRNDALYLTTFAAGLMTLVGGVADLSILSKSSVVFKWSPTIARWSVALTIGLGIGLVIAAVLLTRPASLTQEN
jgi:hypothetical protein